MVVLVWTLGFCGLVGLSWPLAQWTSGRSCGGFWTCASGSCFPCLADWSLHCYDRFVYPDGLQWLWLLLVCLAHGGLVTICPSLGVRLGMMVTAPGATSGIDDGDLLCGLGWVRQPGGLLWTLGLLGLLCHLAVCCCGPFMAVDCGFPSCLDW